MNWQENLLESIEQIRALILATRRIAVLGIKTEAQADQPSVYVPMYLQGAGFEIVPVPVYYPDAKIILGEKVYRKLIDVPGEIDMVVNTPTGPTARADGYAIRAAATSYDIPIITTVQELSAAVQAIEAAGLGPMTVTSLQEHDAARAAR